MTVFWALAETSPEGGLLGEGEEEIEELEDEFEGEDEFEARPTLRASEFKAGHHPQASIRASQRYSAAVHADC